jgi:hypothetical protein
MIEQILFIKTGSILLIEERSRKDIVIGVPHHSIGGIKELPCREHREADENSGLIGRQIAKSLDLSSIIACNYRIDSNKNLRTDYSMQIAQWGPRFLIEIHGHGAKVISDYKIEISAGSIERNDFSKSFSDILQKKLLNNVELKKYTTIGDFNILHYKGTNSATIMDTRWISLQIELPPSIRLNPVDNKLPTFSSDLIQNMIDTINEVCK